MESLKKYVPLVMFSCKRTTELINKSEISPLSFQEKLILWYHNSLCEVCLHYKLQSHKIDTIFFNTFAEMQTLKKLSSEKKENIIKKIKDLS